MIKDTTIATLCNCAKLRAATRVVTRQYDEALKPTGLKANQLTMLIAISIMQPVSISDLASTLSMDRTTLTRNLTPLEKENLITLEAGVGRTRNISLTEIGRVKVDHAKPLWNQAQNNIKKKLGKENLQHLSDILSLLSE